MRLFGLTFNLANAWALPLIIGAAVEYGANIYLRSVERLPAGTRLPRSAVRTVVLNGRVDDPVSRSNDDEMARSAGARGMRRLRDKRLQRRLRLLFVRPRQGPRARTSLDRSHRTGPCASDSLSARDSLPGVSGGWAAAPSPHTRHGART